MSRPPAARAVLLAAILSAIGFAALSPAIAVGDSASYLGPARAWAAGQGLMEGARPLESRLPLYPLALGLLIRLGAGSAMAISLFNALCHVGAVLIVRRVLVDRLPGSIADVMAGSAIVYPPLVTATGLILQESLLSLLLACFFLALWNAVARASVVWSLIAGVALGLSCLAKVTAVPLVVPAALLVALPPRPGLRPLRPRLVRGLVLVLAAGATLMPWAMRNRATLGRFEVTNGNGGVTFLGGTVSNEIADWSAFPEFVAARRAWILGDRVAHPVLDRYLYLVALRRVRVAPGHWLALVAGRALRFMLPARHWFVVVGLARTGTFPPWYLALAAVNVGLFGLAAWTAVVGVRSRDLPLLVAPLIVFGHQLVYALSYVSPRYAVTVGPVLFGAAGLAIAKRSPDRSP
jgi:4-amino-4-deoxy-L-arabinose transferase-like glycosyltransferase